MRLHKLAALLESFLSLLLRLYPAEYRADYGAEMLRTFRAACHEIAQQGRLDALIHLWAATLLDVVFSAALEHASSARPPALLRLSGAACMAGGALWAALHSPFAPPWFVMPVVALALLLLGLMGLHAMLVHTAGRSGWPEFALSSGGLLVTQAGYVAAGLGWWQQSGITPFIGTLLLCLGLLGMGRSMLNRGPLSRARLVMLALSALSGLAALPLLRLLQVPTALDAPLALLVVLVHGFVMGLLWIVLGFSVWQAAGTPSVLAVD